jgi:preprotein translocase subunit SecE
MAKDGERTTPADWFRDAQQYLLDVRSEFRKVTWPHRKEAVGGTVGVVIVVAVITLVLGVVDVSLAQVIRWVMS